MKLSALILFGLSGVFTDAAAIAEHAKDLPTVQHRKEAGNGYVKGSPLYQKQKEWNELNRPGGKPDPKLSECGLTIAIGLVAAAVVIPLVLHLSLSQGLVATLTLKFVDVFVSIFLAILMFSCSTQAFETFEVAKLFPYAEEVFSFVQLVVLYIIAVLIAYLYRDNTLVLTTFCSCGAHYIGFIGMAGGSVGQRNATYAVGKNFGAVAAIGWCVVVAVGLFCCSILGRVLWRAGVKHPKLHHNIDEMELDIMGLTISFLVTQALQHVLTGKYPAAHLFLQGYYKHTTFQKMFMLLWAIGLTIAAAFALPRLKKLAHRFDNAKWINNLIHVYKVVNIMLVAWGYLLWGTWTFKEDIMAGHDKLFIYMVFALVATVVCMAVLLCLGRAWDQHPSNMDPATQQSMQQTFNIVVTGISLVAAWSWEHCFAKAFDIIGKEYQVGYKGLVPKLVLAVTLPLVLLPTYVVHIKTRVIENEEKEEHESSSAHSTARH